MYTIGNRRNGKRLLSLLLLFLLAPGMSMVSMAQSETGQDIEELRLTALQAVNADRAEQDLPPLSYEDALNTAAQQHAEDMAERNYYSHVSPEGETVQDRYEAAGGSPWELTAENIARCTDCVPSVSRVEQLQQGWMESPEHRANILAVGIEAFGFGLDVGHDDTLFAVQAFSGSGTPRGTQSEGGTRSTPAEEQAIIFADVVNSRRQEQGLKPLEVSAILNQAAASLISSGRGAELGVSEDRSLYDALPRNEQNRWNALSMVSGTCGGCGREPKVADIEIFASDWLDQERFAVSLLTDRHTHLGFRMEADGRGKKVAVAIVGEAR